MKCQDCSNSNLDSDFFCRECGASFVFRETKSSGPGPKEGLTKVSREMRSAPGVGVALGLGVFALFTFVFPILSLPCSITGTVLAKRALNIERGLHAGLTLRTRAALWINILCIFATALVVIFSLPAAIDRNFG